MSPPETIGVHVAGARAACPTGRISFDSGSGFDSESEVALAVFPEACVYMASRQKS
jgi:hypothetical protein